ncbi:uncharacterized protein LOC116213109 [Punica granatum]|uniref:Uncharacterized protein LOC116213109 n=1 Tax=Punica granatum TaxID=22663 RepID=A0A218W5V7_PUNGR|nr:uncharacterized protein LOC116213109 [Punica granatum]OWM67670.1 hypothetical protein CDL15_Pgr024755 [Punica granatum]
MASNPPTNKAETNPLPNKEEESAFKEAIDMHQKALDDLVNVNSLFTIAVFVGLTFSGSLSLEVRSQCKVPNDVARSLLVYEVISFACYLLSSLVAKALKMHLSTYLFSKIDQIKKPRSKYTRSAMLTLSAWGSIFGCIFLTMSMVHVVRIRLGRISCNHDSMSAAGGLIAIVSLALLIYIPFTMVAIYSANERFDNIGKKQ